jgi:uncharacterized protein (TIGR02186 family)
MKRIATLIATVLMLAPPAAAENLISGLSQDRIQITSSYSGTDIVVFGAIENAGDPKGRDVVVVVSGPTTHFTVRRKARIAGVWVNSDRVIVKSMPTYYYLAATRPIESIADEDTLGRYGLGLDNIEPLDSTAVSPAKRETYRSAIVRAKERQSLYSERQGGVEFIGPSLFRVRVPVPATAARGEYQANVYLFRDGAMISTQSSPLFIEQAGLERRLYDFAHVWPLAYGVSAVVMSLLLGWLSSVVFRQNR